MISGTSVGGVRKRKIVVTWRKTARGSSHVATKREVRRRLVAETMSLEVVFYAEFGVVRRCGPLSSLLLVETYKFCSVREILEGGLHAACARRRGLSSGDARRKTHCIPFSKSQADNSNLGWTGYRW